MASRPKDTQVTYVGPDGTQITVPVPEGYDGPESLTFWSDSKGSQTYNRATAGGATPSDDDVEAARLAAEGSSSRTPEEGAPA